MEKDTTILPLEDLAQRITDHSEISDRSKLEAARLLAEARRRVDAGEIPCGEAVFFPDLLERLPES